MDSKCYALILLIISFLPLQSFPQKDWELKSDKDGIKVYTKYTDNSKYKAVRTVCTLQTRLSAITALLLDIDRVPDWVYATKSCKLLKTINAAELIYHSEIAVPWPFSNRDFIVRIQALQDAKTKAVTVIGENKPTYITQTKDVVRIQYSQSKWVITPMGNGQQKVEFELQTDPGGNIPAWLINMFATKGPLESFKKLKAEINKPVYANAALPFIRE